MTAFAVNLNIGVAGMISRLRKRLAGCRSRLPRNRIRRLIPYAYDFPVRTLLSFAGYDHPVKQLGQTIAAGGEEIDG